MNHGGIGARRISIIHQALQHHNSYLRLPALPPTTRAYHEKMVAKHHDELRTLLGVTEYERTRTSATTQRQGQNARTDSTTSSLSSGEEV